MNFIFLCYRKLVLGRSQAVRHGFLVPASQVRILAPQPFMKNFLDKFFSRSKNLDYISQNLKQITLTTPTNKIFEAINNFSEKSEIRYVGGCVRKVIKKENVDDIDLATNLSPPEVCEAVLSNLKKILSILIFLNNLL